MSESLALSHLGEDTSQSSQADLLVADGISKEYPDRGGSLSILKNINLVLKRGQSIAIMGASGAGKSTLLHILGGLDVPLSGEVQWNGHNIHRMSEAQRCHWRNHYLGFVYQFHHLLPELNALENVAIPLIIRGVKAKPAGDLAWDSLGRVGLQPRAHHRPAELSGGERQRVALARALVGSPLCVLADEPTGNLDRENAHSVHQLIRDLRVQSGTTFILVTHDSKLAEQQDRLYRLEQGSLQEVMPSIAVETA